MRPYDMYIKLYGKLPTERDPRYLELVRMTKYRITNIVDTQPGKCANCGASRLDGRTYIDFGLEVEFYGTVIFCSICIGDMARNLGAFRALELKILQLENKIEELKGNKNLSEELKNTVLLTYEQIKDLFNADTNNANSNTDSNSDNVTDSDRLADSSGTVSSTSSENNKPGSTEPKLRATKSLTESGSTNVPSLAKLIGPNK